ncbi:MAG: TrkA family potassium uptake protein [Candidatus Omnitrophica bacterium]|nr:TrkA family potassium uptake protein [Candidatus Omnitrophota bacterium]
MRQFAVIGLGRFGFKVAETLSELGAEVLAIDMDANLVQKAKEGVTHAVQLDSTDEEALKACGIESIDAAIVAIGEDIQSNILTSALLKKLGVKEIVARANTELHKEILKTVGVTKIVIPEEDMGVRVAKSIFSPQILEHIELSEGHALVEIEAHEDFLGKTLGDLDLRKKYKVNVIAIKKPKPGRGGENETTEYEIHDIPSSWSRIQQGDVLVVVGTEEDIEKLRKEQ